MKTRAVLALSALLASGLGAGADAAVKKKPKTPACVSFSDPADDARVGQQGSAPATDKLDVSKVTFAISNGVLNGKILMPKFDAAGQYSDGYRADIVFTVGGKVITLFALDGKAWPVLSTAFAQQGIRVDGTYKSGTNAQVTRTVQGTTVVVSAKLADIAAAAGVPVEKQTLTDLQVIVWGNYEALALKVDDAAGTKAAAITCL